MADQPYEDYFTQNFGKRWEDMSPDERKAAHDSTSASSIGYDLLNRGEQKVMDPKTLESVAGYVPLIGPALKAGLAGARGVAEEGSKLSPEQLREGGLAGTAYRLGSAGLGEAGRSLVSGLMPSMPEGTLFYGESGKYSASVSGRSPVPPNSEKIRNAEDIMKEYGASRAQPATSSNSTSAGPTLPPSNAPGGDQPGQEYKNVIRSRPGGPGEGRMVFETQRVPVGSSEQTALPPDQAAQWNVAAAAENPRRAEATSQYGGINPSGRPSTGFQVRSGPGGFSPGRQISDVLQGHTGGIAGLAEEDILKESPAVQDILHAAQAREIARQQELGKIQDVATARRLQTAEAGLKEEQLAEARNPALAVQHQTALYDQVRQEMENEPGVQAQIQYMLQKELDKRRAAGKNPDKLEEQIILAGIRKIVVPEERIRQRLEGKTWTPGATVAAQRGLLPSG